MDFSVIIATYNRASLLEGTLASLAALQPGAPWEVIVVDNNSPDHTRELVHRVSAAFPAPLRYAFEREQGRSAALNCGFRMARGRILVTTDDDVRVEADWLNRIEAAFRAHACDYVGGRVLPVWGAPPPRWLPSTNGLLWAAIALLDYGPQPIRFGTRVPLGVNMAMRRDAIERVGGFDARIGRKAGTLLGQEVREWCLRAHAEGLTGFYVPDIVVRHLIPAERLTKRYFRRWFFWRGISRAMLYAETGLDMEKPEQTTLDFAAVPHIAGVPRYLFRGALRAGCDMVEARLRANPVTAFERELWLWTFAGIVRQRWQDRRRPIVRRMAPVGGSNQLPLIKSSTGRGD
jgi:glycosyltransferase involved in cell wall biosynthesis